MVSPVTPFVNPHSRTDACLQLLLRPRHAAAGQRKDGQSAGENHQARRPEFTPAGVFEGTIGEAISRKVEILKNSN